MVQFVNRYVDQLSKHFDDIPRLKGLADSFNVGTGHIALGLIALTCFCVLIGQGVNFFVNLLGVVYPAYMSFKALESEGHADDKQWLCYWVVFGVFTTTDTLTDSLLCWVPFYQPTKLLMLLFLAWPETRGAQLVYDRFLQPFLKKHQIKIDEALSNVGEKVQEAKSEAMHKVVDSAMRQSQENKLGANVCEVCNRPEVVFYTDVHCVGDCKVCLECMAALGVPTKICPKCNARRLSDCELEMILVYMMSLRESA
jgi:receptor expression-enhancing protein 5/6